MLICAYEQAELRLIKHGQKDYPYSKDYGPVWLCLECGAYVGCHPGTEKPLGRTANAELRAAKIKAHAAFDRLWKAKMNRDGISKGAARRAGYGWLSEQLGLPKEKTHIALFDVDTCQRVEEICRPYLKGI